MAGEKLRLGTEVHRLRLGESFSKNSQTAFHTFRYDFKPASVDTKKMATVDIGSNNQATVTVPHTSGTSHTVFKGPCTPCVKECVLIIDHSTGDIVLEKLSSGIRLKKTRAEGSSKMQPPTSLVEHSLPQQQQLQPTQPFQSNKKLSPTQKYSPVQRLPPSPGRKLSPKHLSPNRNSPTNVTQRSPANQRSPSMPSLIQPPANSSNNKTAPMAFVKEGSMPIFTIEDTNLPEPMDVAASEVGILSDSSNDSSSNSESNSSSSSESSDSENDGEPVNSAKATSPAAISTQRPNTVMNGSHHSSRPLPSMPQFNQLNEDLHLSESESD